MPLLWQKLEGFVGQVSVLHFEENVKADTLANGGGTGEKSDLRRQYSFREFAELVEVDKVNIVQVWHQ